ncbi:FCD domain-containing protein [Tabrizicola sp. J26]|uniref:FadR/GntR family transcriptional regulator n=1 Tax=Alitabrizicola rongguiensis TaxID=2909234 RepID=UPI001F30E703|nr:FCD domain-containing protein [Tabrizicola rongguiensis]MCF1707937.1 FCD domain-containing protein [Tabrizicola rongguiensis]
MIEDLGRLSAPPAYQLVSQELRKLILSGGLKPGDPFPSEIALAERLGVNRSTVREGIRQLEADGLVSREGRKRLYVSVPEAAQIAPRTTDALILSAVTFGELWEVSRVLEPLSARLAAAKRSEEQVAALRANLEEMRPEVELGKLTGETDLAFHALVAAAAGNSALLMAREPVGQLLYPAFEQFEAQLPQAGKRQLKAHSEIVSGIERGDGAHAEMWMARHIDDLKRGWELAKLPMDRRISPIPRG